MSRTIALIDYHFLTEERIEKIRRIAEPAGFELKYFETHKAAEGHIADAEILFGMVGRKNIREAKDAASIRPFTAGRMRALPILPACMRFPLRNT